VFVTCRQPLDRATRATAEGTHHARNVCRDSARRIERSTAVGAEKIAVEHASTGDIERRAGADGDGEAPVADRGLTNLRLPMGHELILVRAFRRGSYAPTASASTAGIRPPRLIHNGFRALTKGARRPKPPGLPDETTRRLVTGERYRMTIEQGRLDLFLAKSGLPGRHGAGLVLRGSSTRARAWRLLMTHGV